MDLIISIINYKTRKLTSDCIDSILSNRWNCSFQIWIVDNNSLDGSVEQFKKRFPKIKLIESDKNIGFAGGHNLVLKNAKARYYLILNSDTLVLSNTLDEMVRFMDSHLDVGIASCKVLNPDGSLQPNGGDLPFGLSLINWLFNMETFGINSPMFHREDPEYYKNVREVEWVSGNFMMVRADVFKKIGFLNDDYFMYFEDTEFCYRAKKAGFKIMFYPKVFIKHLSGGSLDEPEFRQWLGEYKGLIRFYSSFGSFYGLMIKLLIYFTTILRIVAFRLAGNVKFSKTYAKVISNI